MPMTLRDLLAFLLPDFERSTQSFRCEPSDISAADYLLAPPMTQIYLVGIQTAKRIWKKMYNESGVFPFDVKTTNWRQEKQRENNPIQTDKGIDDCQPSANSSNQKATYTSKLTIWEWFTDILLPDATPEEKATIPASVVGFMKAYLLPPFCFLSPTTTTTTTTTTSQLLDGVLSSLTQHTAWLTADQFKQLTQHEQMLYIGFFPTKAFYDIVGRRQNKPSAFLFPHSFYEKNKTPQEGQTAIRTDWPTSDCSMAWVCEILPGRLYFGPTPTPVTHLWGRKKRDAKFIADSMLSCGVTEQVSLLRGEDEMEEIKQAHPHIALHSFPVRDTIENDTAEMKQVIDAIHTLLQKSPQTVVYVHCVAGFHRSAAAVIGYLILHGGMDVFQARRYFNQRRPTSRIRHWMPTFCEWSEQTTKKGIPPVCFQKYYFAEYMYDRMVIDVFGALLSAIPELEWLAEFPGTFIYDAFLSILRKQTSSTSFTVDVLKRELAEFIKQEETEKNSNAAAKQFNFDDSTPLLANRLPPDCVLERLVELAPLYFEKLTWRHT